VGPKGKAAKGVKLTTHPLPYVLRENIERFHKLYKYSKGEGVTVSEGWFQYHLSVGIKICFMDAVFYCR